MKNIPPTFELRIKTHSIYSHHIKCYLIDLYSYDCHEIHCHICSNKLLIRGPRCCGNRLIIAQVVAITTAIASIDMGWATNCVSISLMHRGDNQCLWCSLMVALEVVKMIPVQPVMGVFGRSNDVSVSVHSNGSVVVCFPISKFLLDSFITW